MCYLKEEIKEHIRHYDCTLCSESTTIMWGGWPKHLSMRDVLDKGYIKSEIAKRDIERYWFGENILIADYYFSGYICIDCHALHQRPHIILALKSGCFYIPEYRCDKCNGVLREIDESEVVNIAKCVHCGGDLAPNILEELF